jgi:hypothetical protein
MTAPSGRRLIGIERLIAQQTALGVANGLSAEVRELAEGIAHEAAGDPEFRRLVREAARAIIAALHQPTTNSTPKPRARRRTR